MILRLISALFVASLFALSPTALSAADEKAKSSSTSASKQVPEGQALSILIRRTLLTLNDANLTGNYTVMRDLAAPGFQSANDPAKLAGIFTKLRAAKIDMAPIMYFDPKLVRPAEINDNGMLRVSGFIPTRPQQVNFDMLFQKVAGRWRLFGIAVNTTAAQPQAATLAPELPKGAANGAAAKKGDTAKKK
jgi:hypothetical protein